MLTGSGAGVEPRPSGHGSTPSNSGRGFSAGGPASAQEERAPEEKGGLLGERAVILL